MSVEIHTPITEEAAAILQVGDTVTITGYFPYCGQPCRCGTYIQ